MTSLKKTKVFKKLEEREDDAEDIALDDSQEDRGRELQTMQWQETTVTVPFLYLSLDIPPTPLFKDSQGGLVIPQIPLFEVLKKFDGETWTDQMGSGNIGHCRKKYLIKELPQFLLFHLVRFTKNNFYLEKNHTIVTFPVKNLELKDYLQQDSVDFSSCPTSDLNTYIRTSLPLIADTNQQEVYEQRFRGAIERAHLEDIAR